MNSSADGSLTGLAGTWWLDPTRTTITFRTRALFVRAKGTLRATEGTATIASDGRVTGTLTIDPASIKSRINKRDHHLRSADFFHVERHPAITFTAADIHHTASGHHVLSGDIEIQGRSTPLTLPVTVTGEGDALVIAGEGIITKHHLGMKKAALTKSRVYVTAHFQRARS